MKSSEIHSLLKTKVLRPYFKGAIALDKARRQFINPPAFAIVNTGKACLSTGPLNWSDTESFRKE